LRNENTGGRLLVALQLDKPRRGWLFGAVAELSEAQGKLDRSAIAAMFRNRAA
jgi:hypothetical protein